MCRLMSFIAPDNGEEITAEWTTATDFAIHKMQRGLCGTKAHSYAYILCITQWGFDRQTDIVVARCKRCGETKAYKLVTLDAEEKTAETGPELEGRAAV